MYAVNQLPRRDMAKSTTGCCPPFDPADWDGQIFEFDQKLFMKFSTRSFLHIPLNMTSAMTKAMTLVDKAGAASSDQLMLSDEVSPWKADHYVAVTKPVPGGETVRLSGTYLTKVFDGPFKEMSAWYQQLVDYVKSKGHVLIKTYFNYTLCPKCAKSYGKNYVVGFAQIA